MISFLNWECKFRLQSLFHSDITIWNPHDFGLWTHNNGTKEIGGHGFLIQQWKRQVYYSADKSTLKLWCFEKFVSTNLLLFVNFLNCFGLYISPLYCTLFFRSHFSLFSLLVWTPAGWGEYKNIIILLSFNYNTYFWELYLYQTCGSNSSFDSL